MQHPNLTLNMIHLDPSRSESMQYQLYSAMREAIVSRQLQPGGRLPSTRELAQRWQVSRNTVMGAFDQLIAEGYLEGRQGAGTFITSRVPDSYFRAAKAGPEACSVLVDRRASDLRDRLKQDRDFVCRRWPLLPLRPTVPCLKSFPMQIWEQCRRSVLRHGENALLTYGDTLGYAPLRKAIATYLRDSRGVRCDASQVILCCGSQQGIYLAASLLLEKGDVVWMEDPGYNGANLVYKGFGCKLQSVPIDRDGMNISGAANFSGPARVIHVSPSHQFPLGSTLSLERRLQLLDYARENGAYIIEDDYDSEYRYEGKPIASLQGLDQSGSTIYIGTFSKVLFPSLRLGYLVVPAGLVELFEHARSRVDGNPTIVDPATLALFMEEGHFARHIRRMRSLYKERLEVLQHSVRKHLAGVLSLEGQQCGMHAVGRLHRDVDDELLSAQALRNGVVVPSLSGYCREAKVGPGFVMGFAGFEAPLIEAAVERLSAVIGD
jgi:GntR family transcriptional regulator/MocR family aminotransferase